MKSIHVHQIYYSEQTRRELDPGFAPLDNLSNERPDWREYWPIRNFLLRRPLSEDGFYGFFSPKFGRKTSLCAAQVNEFIQSVDDATDAVIFSPYVDQSAFFPNVFLQGESHHAGLLETAQEFVRRIGWETDLAALVMDSASTIFCNFFAAKPRFWKAWLDIGERLFSIAESADTELGRRLNLPAEHESGAAPMKVFVIERIASLLLAVQSGWKKACYDPYLLPRTSAPIAGFAQETLELDALKHAHLSLGHPEYLDAYFELRQRTIARLTSG